MSNTNGITFTVAGFTSASVRDEKWVLMNWELTKKKTWKAHSTLKCTTEAGSNTYYPPKRGITGDIRKKGADRYYDPSSYSAMQGFFGEGTQKALKTELAENGISANLGTVRLVSIQLCPDQYFEDIGKYRVNMSQFTFEIIPEDEMADLEFDNMDNWVTKLNKKANEMLN
jgi:hypothetical protein